MRSLSIGKIKLIRILIFIAFLIAIYIQQKDTRSQETDQTAKTASSALMPIVKSLLPHAVSIEREPAETSLGQICDHNDAVIGYYVQTSPYADEVTGYAGPVPLLIVFDVRKTISAVIIMQNNETRSFIKRTQDKQLLSSWNGLSIQEALNKDVDAITGATRTSSAVINTFKKRLELIAPRERHTQRTIGNSILKKGAAFLVISFGLLSFFLPKTLRKTRMLLMIANVSVLGFLNGYLLSLALFYAWLMNGIPWRTMPFMVIVAVLTVLLPLITNKKYYCIYVCPFGALQELAGKIRHRHVQLPSRMLKWLKGARIVFLLSIAITLLIGIHIDLSYFEPFAAFIFSSASQFIIILAVVFVIASLFLPRFWCSSLCPTGQIADLFMIRAHSSLKEQSEKSSVFY